MIISKFFVNFADKVVKGGSSRVAPGYLLLIKGLHDFRNLKKYS